MPEYTHTHTHGKLSNNRIQWIDIAKGLGIILIILGHTSNNAILSKYIYCFHVPLFFLISGYLYTKRDNLIKRKTKSLLLPYCIFSILSFGYWLIERMFREQEISSLKVFANIFIAQGPSEKFIYNAALWFLPCLFITEILFDIIYKKTTKNSRFLIIFATSILGYVYPKITTIRLPFCIDVAMTALMFYYIGFLFKQVESKMIFNKKIINILIIILGIIGIFAYSCTQQSTDMLRLDYGMNYLMFYLIGCLGSYIVYTTSKEININYITWIGRNSLYFMCLHEPVKRIIIKIYSTILKISTDDARGNVIHIILMTIITTLIVSILVVILNKILEFIEKKAKKA